MIYEELIEELALTLLTKARYEGCISKRKFAGVLITEYFIWALTFVGAFSIGGKHDL